MKYLLSASSKSTPKCSVEYFDINEKKKNDFFQLEMREMLIKKKGNDHDSSCQA